MVIPATYAQANFRFGNEAAPTGAECTLGLNPLDGTDTPLVVATAVGSAFNTHIMPLLSGSLQFLDVLVKFGPDETGPSAEYGLGTFGELSSMSEVPSVAALIQKNTALGGRAGRGRMYVPGVPETLVNSSGQLVAPYDTQLTDAFEAFRAQLLAADIEPVLLHGVSSPITIPTVITSFTASTRVATQRRRLRR